MYILVNASQLNQKPQKWHRARVAMKMMMKIKVGSAYKISTAKYL